MATPQECSNRCDSRPASAPRRRLGHRQPGACGRRNWRRGNESAIGDAGDRTGACRRGPDARACPRRRHPLPRQHLCAHGPGACANPDRRSRHRRRFHRGTLEPGHRGRSDAVRTPPGVASGAASPGGARARARRSHAPAAPEPTATPAATPVPTPAATPRPTPAADARADAGRPDAPTPAPRRARDSCAAAPRRLRRLPPPRCQRRPRRRRRSQGAACRDAGSDTAGVTDRDSADTGSPDARRRRPTIAAAVIRRARATARHRPDTTRARTRRNGRAAGGKSDQGNDKDKDDDDTAQGRQGQGPQGQGRGRRRRRRRAADAPGVRRIRRGVGARSPGDRRAGSRLRRRRRAR